jgi:threonine dehydratase
MTGPRVGLDDIRRAAAGLVGLARRTPLVESPALSRAAGVEVRLKCEHLQPIGAFKVRGASTAILRLAAADRARGVVTHSSGNHGQAVAWAARRLGTTAVVVMPRSAPAIKVEGVRREGGEVIFVETMAEREPTARRLADERGLVLIPPYEHADVIAGQGTCGLEILEQWPGVGTLLVPVGGGGLLAGIATAVGALRPDVRIVGVEPAPVPKLSAALAAGRPVEVERQVSLADGLLPPALGTLAFAQVAGVVREAAGVTDDDLRAAVRFLFETQGLRVEPSGAATVAALLAGRVHSAGPTVAVLTGGNVDPDLFDRLVG